MQATGTSTTMGAGEVRGSCAAPRGRRYRPSPGRRPTTAWMSARWSRSPDRPPIPKMARSPLVGSLGRSRSTTVRPRTATPTSSPARRAQLDRSSCPTTVTTRISPSISPPPMLLGSAPPCHVGWCTERHNSVSTPCRPVERSCTTETSCRHRLRPKSRWAQCEPCRPVPPNVALSSWDGPTAAPCSTTSRSAPTTRCSPLPSATRSWSR